MTFRWKSAERILNLKKQILQQHRLKRGWMAHNLPSMHLWAQWLPWVLGSVCANWPKLPTHIPIYQHASRSPPKMAVILALQWLEFIRSHWPQTQACRPQVIYSLG